MSVNVADLTFTSMETVTLFDVNTGNYLFTIDEIQDFSISQTQDTTDVTGKNGRKLATIKRNKAVTLSGTNGLISAGLLEMQTGSEFENTTTTVRWTDYLSVADNTATTTYTAVGTEGAEIIGLYIKNNDGTLEEELTQDSSAGDGTFAYDASTKALTFSNIDDGTDIVVFYDRTISADVLENDSETYSLTGTMYADFLAEDKCSNVYRVQVYVPKADFSGEFSLDISDSQAVHSFEVTALAGACGTSGQYYTLTIFDSDAEDAEEEAA